VDLISYGVSVLCGQRCCRKASYRFIDSSPVEMTWDYELGGVVPPENIEAMTETIQRYE